MHKKRTATLENDNQWNCNLFINKEGQIGKFHVNIIYLVMVAATGRLGEQSVDLISCGQKKPKGTRRNVIVKMNKESLNAYF